MRCCKICPAAAKRPIESINEYFEGKKRIAPREVYHEF
jgi:hypothetical protein